jgi:NADH-quinone oxidoreductase subunit N
MSFTNSDWGTAAAELFLLLMLVVTVVTALFAPRRRELLSYACVLAALAGAALLTLLQDTTTVRMAFNGLYVHTALTALLKLFVYVSVFMTLIYSKHYVADRDVPGAEYYILTLFSTLGMSVLVSANSLLVVYLGLELLSLPLYALVSLDRSNTENTEAALKYFVMGAIASALLLYGMSLLYGATGTLSIPQIATVVSALAPQNKLLLVIAMVFLLGGIGFKLAAAPFHMWAPDVYSGAPLSVTLLVSTAPKLAAFAMLLRLVVGSLAGIAAQWQAVLIVLAVLSMGIGNLFALAQDNIRRLFAYSAIAHTGYLLLGVLTATPAGYAASLFYSLTYVLSALAAFGLLVILAKDGFEPESLSDLSGLNARSPWLAALMLITLLSLAGIPPTVGFFAKFLVLKALIDAKLVGLALLAMFFAIVGLYYYLRVIKIMYFDAPTEPQPFVYASECHVAISLNGLVLLGLGLFPLSLLHYCQLAVK